MINVNQIRFEFAQSLVIQALRLHGFWFEVMANHIGCCDEFIDGFASRRRLKVQRDALFIAIK